MDTAAARAFLNDQIPIKQQILLPPAFRAAYAAVKDLVKEVPFLRVGSAEFNAGRMRTWAVDHAVENLIQSGQWNVDYRWRTFGSPRPTGKFIEIRLPHSKMTISQVADPSKQPRNVRFRENARLFNHPFLPFEDLKADAEISGRPAFLMLHGHQELDFLHAAMPYATRRYGYICRTTNLLSLPYEVTQRGPAPEDTSFKESTIQLKDQIAKWLKDNHGA